MSNKIKIQFHIQFEDCNDDEDEGYFWVEPCEKIIDAPTMTLTQAHSIIQNDSEIQNFIHNHPDYSSYVDTSIEKVSLIC